MNLLHSNKITITMAVVVFLVFTVIESNTLTISEVLVLSICLGGVFYALHLWVSYISKTPPEKSTKVLRTPAEERAFKKSQSTEAIMTLLGVCMAVGGLVAIGGRFVAESGRECKQSPTPNTPSSRREQIEPQKVKKARVINNSGNFRNLIVHHSTRLKSGQGIDPRGMAYIHMPSGATESEARDAAYEIASMTRMCVKSVDHRCAVLSR